MWGGLEELHTSKRGRSARARMQGACKSQKPSGAAALPPGLPPLQSVCSRVSNRRRVNSVHEDSQGQIMALASR